LELTIEQNSFMVGQVCEKGESKNAFIPNEVCNFDLCSLMEDFCKLFETKGVFGIKDLPTDYRDFIAIGPVTIPQVE
uniref:Uncharacterized protein n=1 Tax=Acrobeloides nanus TaxID=290746 RepID=A0A914DKN0_9BILA